MSCRSMNAMTPAATIDVQTMCLRGRIHARIAAQKSVTDTCTTHAAVISAASLES